MEYIFDEENIWQKFLDTFCYVALWYICCFHSVVLMFLNHQNIGDFDKLQKKKNK